MAAVMACGSSAALSHRSAAALWALLPALPRPVDVAVPDRGSRRRRTGIRLHRSRSLTFAVVTRCKGIAVTTPARTIADLRRVASAAQLRRAIREAEASGYFLGSDVDPDPTRSELEHHFLALCRRHRLPAPEVNVRIAPFVVDFLWREQSLVVETDGYRYHRGQLAFEEDHQRDVELRILGFDVIRFTYRQVSDDPKGVARALRASLA